MEVEDQLAYRRQTGMKSLSVLETEGIPLLQDLKLGPGVLQEQCSNSPGLLRQVPPPPPPLHPTPLHPMVESCPRTGKATKAYIYLPPPLPLAPQCTQKASQLLPKLETSNPLNPTQ
jgi:hypothetical protein